MMEELDILEKRCQRLASDPSTHPTPSTTRNDPSFGFPPTTQVPAPITATFTAPATSSAHLRALSPVPPPPITDKEATLRAPPKGDPDETVVFLPNLVTITTPVGHQSIPLTPQFQKKLASASATSQQMAMYDVVRIQSTIPSTSVNLSASSFSQAPPPVQVRPQQIPHDDELQRKMKQIGKRNQVQDGDQ